jgi:hypothetical protein
MIYGKKSILSALQSIEVSSFVFHLTGSRYFGTQREDSDWDFFVDYSAELITWLEDNSFTLDSTSYKEDPVMCMVYKKENVHIQVVHSAKMKEWIQHLLYPLFRGMKPDKETSKKLWIHATRLYKAGMDGVNIYKIQFTSPPDFEDRQDY